MSDKLVLEFYDRRSTPEPVVTVMALHGGDNPESAAETLADFFLQVGDLPELNWEDAGSLAARFIALQQGIRYGFSELGILSAFPIGHQPTYGRQLVRVFGSKRGPIVEFVPDGYTKPEELAVAKHILEELASGLSHCGVDRESREGLNKSSRFPQRLKPHSKQAVCGGTKVPPFQNGDW